MKYENFNFAICRRIFTIISSEITICGLFLHKDSWGCLCILALSTRPFVGVSIRSTLIFPICEKKKKNKHSNCDRSIIISVFGFPSAQGENTSKYISKHFRSLTRDYILSKFFDYYLTKKDKVLVVFFIPCSLKLNKSSYLFVADYLR